MPALFLPSVTRHWRSPRLLARVPSALSAALLAVALLATAAPAAAAQAQAELVVSAAASLTNAFRAVAQAWEAANPGMRVVLNFGASDVLMRQIVEGAPADVFASADQSAMDRAQAAGMLAAGSRRDFAGNTLVLVVPASVPSAVAGPADLRSDAVRRIAYGNPASVPVGRYAREALQEQGLWEAVQARGVPAQNVRQALDYVARGEVDAGIVFATDAAAMPQRVRVVTTLPTRTPIAYPIAITARAAGNAAAARFTAFVGSVEGRQILARHGFSAPP
ncbi:molybdate ABC transporter substrate-binding protein [Paracidovorax citrulli]